MMSIVKKSGLLNESDKSCHNLWLSGHNKKRFAYIAHNILFYPVSISNYYRHMI